MSTIFITTAQVDLPILQQLNILGVNALTALGGVDIFFQRNGTLLAHRNKIMNLLGQGFRLWCKRKRIEKPPSTWDLHYIGRGENDSKTAYTPCWIRTLRQPTQSLFYFICQRLQPKLLRIANAPLVFSPKFFFSF